MLRFGTEQKTLRIQEFSVGGIPGERPTVLIGSIFYRGHNVFTDEERGRFDKNRAESLIRTQEELSDRTGNPHVVDVVISRTEAAKNLIDFVVDITKAPIAIDVPSREVKIAALQYIKENRITHPFLYNSLDKFYTIDELKSIQEASISSVIVLAYDPRDLLTTKGRIAAVKEIIPALLEIGIGVPLLDMCVLDLPTFGSALQAIYEAKSHLGLPTGCGAHNAVSLWRGLRAKMGEEVVRACIASSVACAAMAGADFVLYGPIDEARFVYPAVAMVDIAQSQVGLEQGLHISKFHPRYRVASWKKSY
jgi:tetrahydromethanopterin S-methyltransferase subunit H